MLNVSNVDNCTACFACVDSCSHNAINISFNRYGEEIVKVSDTLCRNCGKCLKVCPSYVVNSDNALDNEMYHTICYAVQSKESIVFRKKHSSGALVYELSKYIISRGGVVAGTVWNKSNEVVFKLTDDVNELIHFAGSKYVHSNASGIYRSVVEKLENNVPVLFVGLPCQVSAIKKYAMHSKKSNTDMLYTVDLVCHGTPSSSYFQGYIKHLGLTNSDKICFRGEKDFYLSVYKGGNEVYSVPANRDLYFKSFLDGIIYRDTCYECKFACPQREGDITAGDFWGLNTERTINSFNGRVSLCLVNSAKGEKLFDAVKDNLLLETRDFAEALTENKQLSHPMIRKEDTIVFKENYANEGFCKAMKRTTCYKEVRHNNIQYKIIRLKQMIKTIVGGTIGCQ